MRPGVEGEERLFNAVAMWLRQEIEKALPDGQQGIHAPLLDRAVLAREASRELRKLALDLAEDVRGSAGPPPVDLVPAGLTRRLSVMSNTEPCSTCEKVRRVAVLDYQDGVVTSVECEACAPEFKESP